MMEGKEIFGAHGDGIILTWLFVAMHHSTKWDKFRWIWY